MSVFEFLCEEVNGDLTSVEIEEMTYWSAKKRFALENPVLCLAVCEVTDNKTGATLIY